MHQENHFLAIVQAISLVGLMLAVLVGCENAGNRHAVALEKEPPRMAGAEFSCQHSYWCADIQGPITAKYLNVEKEGRFGKVGIGLPREKVIENKLEVNGTILAEEILVAAHVADYVFSPEYKLEPLEFVDAFIKKHHHLPGIPSKLAVESGGGRMKIGDSYKALLEKSINLLQQDR